MRRRIGQETVWSLHVDGPPAAVGSARARDVLIVPVKVVVDRQLLALRNAAPAEVEDVPLQDAGDQVRITRVVDELGARAAYAAVEGPVSVQLEEVLGILPPLLLLAVELLPRVFEHLASRRDRLARVHAPPMNARTADAPPKAGLPRVDGWSVIGGRLCHDALHFSGAGLGSGRAGRAPPESPQHLQQRIVRASSGAETRPSQAPALLRGNRLSSCARSLYLTARLRQAANGSFGFLPRPRS